MKIKQNPAKSKSISEFALENFDYVLAPERVAQRSAVQRDMSRLMVLNRKTGRILHRRFYQIEKYFAPGDLLVVNDSRVMYSRLYGRKPTGGKVEILLLHEAKPGHWKGLVRNIGWEEEGTVRFDDNSWNAVVRAGGSKGIRDIEFNRPDVQELMEDHGQMPLPPYIKRVPPHPTLSPLEVERGKKRPISSRGTSDGLFPSPLGRGEGQGEGLSRSDRARYQTVFADRQGSAAAPTAGLHFTPELLDRLIDLGVRVIPITLHVGYGTFQLIETGDVSQHQIHSEYYRISRLAARFINEGRARGGKVFAVGTTVVRTLENACDKTGNIAPGSGWNNLYIYGDYRFKVVDHLVTNFHLPKSSLLVLASSFAGRDRLLRAYQEAIAGDYRFYSYGDAMLIL